MTQQQYPAGHLSFLQTSLPRPLTVFLPPVNRYLDSQYVTEFKDSGRLRISSFATFKQHEDEHRRDRSEGYVFAGVNDVDNDRSFFTVSVAGGSAYALSTTMRSGPELAAAFGSSYFEIFEPVGFCAEVANEIPGCTHAMIGQCIYVDRRMLVTEGKAPTMDELKHEGHPDNTVSLDKILAHGASAAGPKPYFLKERKYEWQGEYRFIWETNKSVTAHLDITASGLLRHCKFY